MSVWDPFREMEELRREVDRVFAGFLPDRRRMLRRTVFLPGSSARQYPLVNLFEDGDNLYVEALAPGIDPEELNLTVQGTRLTLSGEKRPPSGVPAEAYHRSERAAGKFVRTVDLPYPVDDVEVTASYQNGLITLTLPKHEAAKPKQIKVQAG